MRVENTVTADQAWATYQRMLAAHGLVAYKSNRMRGRASLTGSKFRAQFIERERS